MTRNPHLNLIHPAERKGAEFRSVQSFECHMQDKVKLPKSKIKTEAVQQPYSRLSHHSFEMSADSGVSLPER